MEAATRIAKKRKLAGAAVAERGRRQFIFCGSAQIAGSRDHVTEGVAVFHAGGETGIEEIGSVGVYRGMYRWAEICEGIGQACKFPAIGFDGVGDGAQGFKSATLGGVGLGGVPLGFERGEIEQQQAKREQLPFGVFADKPHCDLADGCGGSIRRVAEFHRQEGDIVTKLDAADLHFGGDGGSLASKDGTPRGISGGRGFARLVEENEAFHQGDARQGSHAGESLLISRGEKTGEFGMALRAGCGEDVA